MFRLIGPAMRSTPSWSHDHESHETTFNNIPDSMASVGKNQIVVRPPAEIFFFCFSCQCMNSKGELQPSSALFSTRSTFFGQSRWPFLPHEHRSRQLSSTWLCRCFSGVVGSSSSSFSLPPMNGSLPLWDTYGLNGVNVDVLRMAPIAVTLHQSKSFPPSSSPPVRFE